MKELEVKQYEANQESVNKASEGKSSKPIHVPKCQHLGRVQMK